MAPRGKKKRSKAKLALERRRRVQQYAVVRALIGTPCPRSLSDKLPHAAGPERVCPFYGKGRGLLCTCCDECYDTCKAMH